MLIGETKSTLKLALGILDSVGCNVGLVHLLHQGKYFLDRSERRLEEGVRAEGDFLITALMCSNSVSTPVRWNSPSEGG